MLSELDYYSSPAYRSDTTYFVAREVIGVNDYKKFRKSLDETANILYLSDNASEIVLDRVLVEELIGLKKKVVLSVKSEPVTSNSTIVVTKEAGPVNIVRAIETGNDRIR